MENTLIKLTLHDETKKTLPMHKPTDHNIYHAHKC